VFPKSGSTPVPERLFLQIRAPFNLTTLFIHLTTGIPESVRSLFILSEKDDLDESRQSFYSDNIRVSFTTQSERRRCAMQFLSEINLIGALVGFVAGLLGFIIVKIWVFPVTRYAKLKRGLSDLLPAFMEDLGGDTSDDPDTGGGKQAIRQMAADISDSYSHELPQWYRILLKSRGEAPDMAAAALLKLANTRVPEHAERQVERIRQYLNPGNEKKNVPLPRE
jgi:hypothetical protein